VAAAAAAAAAAGSKTERKSASESRFESHGVVIAHRAIATLAPGCERGGRRARWGRPVLGRTGRTDKLELARERRKVGIALAQGDESERGGARRGREGGEYERVRARERARARRTAKLQVTRRGVGAVVSG